MKILRLGLLYVLFGGLLWFGYKWFAPSEEARIQKMLSHLATSASVTEKKSPVAIIMALDRVQACFEPDVEIKVESPIEGISSGISSREDLMQGVKAAWARYDNIKVEIYDVMVTLDSSKETATAMLTAKVSRAGERDFFFQQFRTRLKQTDGNWRIARMEPVKVFH